MATALTAAVQQLERAQAVSAQSLRDDRLSKAQYAELVGLQAALDQLGATLQQWESLTTRLFPSAAARAATSTAAVRHDDERKTR